MWSLQTVLGVLATAAGGVVSLVLLVLWLFPWLKYDFQSLYLLAKTLKRYRSNASRKFLLIDEFEEKVSISLCVLHNNSMLSSMCDEAYSLNIL